MSPRRIYPPAPWITTSRACARCPPRLIQSGVRKNGLRSVAVCEDVTIAPAGQNATKAVKVLVEHRRGPTVVRYVPWQRKRLGRGCSVVVIALGLCGCGHGSGTPAANRESGTSGSGFSCVRSHANASPSRFAFAFPIFCRASALSVGLRPSARILASLAARAATNLALWRSGSSE
jgi:hypothetical protein